MQYRAITIALGTILVAAPAAASDPQGNSMDAKPAAKEKTYCLTYGVDTGSRINRVACKTKKDWQRLGVDLDEVLNSPAG